MAIATLTIKDEVNVKISGLDISDCKTLVNKYKFEVPGARYQPAVRLGRWDGKVSYFSLGGSTYVNLLDEIIPILYDKGYDVELDDQRTYNRSFEFTEVDENTFAHKNWPATHQLAGQPIIIRDYQVTIINGLLANLGSITVAATGSGKTIVTAALSYKCEKYGRSIIIVPNKTLVSQTEEDYINLGLDVGVYFGDRKDFGKTHTICTWQSLNNIYKNTVNGSGDFTLAEFIDGVVCVICDEVHSAKATALKELLTGSFARIPIRWGLTGTIPKDPGDAISLRCSLGPVIGQLNASDLQEQGVLANCHVNILQLIDYVDYKDYQSELKYLTETTGRIAYIASLINTIKEQGNTLILVDRIATGKLLQVQLSTLFSLLSDKPDVVFVSGSTKATSRKEEYADIATSTNKIIIATYGVAAVGLNIPRIFNLVLFEPGKSFVRVIQSIGRGLRKANDKDHVEIYDITSTCKFAKRHLTARKQFYTAANYKYTLEKKTWQ